ncbi:MAG TPA: hypothetical protein VGJ67_05035 [Actinomycetota bacterium]|jgi:hypothetical protein
MSGTRALVVGIAVSFALSLAPGIANASGPQVEHYRDSGSFVDTELCGFPIHVSYRDVGTLYRWFDANGNLVRFTKHSVFSEVDRANGKVATGVDRENLVDTQDGFDLLTGSWIFFLPDGSHIQTAGRIELAYDGDVLTEHGPHPVEEGKLAELFCPPMS